MCPECYCRLPNDAKFCVECGLGIHPQPLETEAAGWSCPRCKVKLQRRRVGELDLFECADCGGVWMPEEAFDEIIRRKDAARAAQEYEGAPPRRSNFRSPPGAEIRYLPCPICENPMNRRNFGRRSGVIIDSCRDHGVWLDNQELNRIIRFVEAGGLEQTRAEEAEDLKREKRRRVSAIQTAGMDALTLSTCATRKPLWGSTLAETAAIALRALFKF
jgi:Zn-finger nucleic acid-binding protein